ncbi:alpha/beta hydrolase family esterase [Actinomadura atramentaria]|uniref:alpha/beta hydrolase family esterase n=1 Tax=Actinomadura atramentaria TaxID=1990 RepID=UPI000371BC06|nr:PHB depolymerase family esterase [Actinomadura atramentaria]
MRRLLRTFLAAPLLVALTLVLALAACDTDKGGGGGGTTTKPPATVDGISTKTGTYKEKLDVGGFGHREYLVHVPPKVAKGEWKDGRLKERLPVVLALHGGVANMGQMEKLTGFDRLADEHGFLAVYPDGFMMTWNAGDCCGAAKIGKIKDVDFLSKLIDKLNETGLVDPKRVYVTGFSNGAGMAYRMACEKADKIAAIGVVEGSLVTKCDPSRPVSAMIFHGTADKNVPFNGGGRRDINDSRGFPPVKDAVKFWREKAGLPDPHERVKAETTGADCEATGKGDGGVEVTFCKIDGGRHQWPAGASQTLWDFFKDHPRS